jgi:chemotaxis signal transduction protein
MLMVRPWLSDDAGIFRYPAMPEFYSGIRRCRNIIQVANNAGILFRYPTMQEYHSGIQQCRNIIPVSNNAGILFRYPTMQEYYSGIQQCRNIIQISGDAGILFHTKPCNYLKNVEVFYFSQEDCLN